MEKIAKFSFSFAAAFIAKVAKNRNPVSKRLLELRVYTEQYLPAENGSPAQASAVCLNKAVITPAEQSCQGVLLNRADRVSSLLGTRNHCSVSETEYRLRAVSKWSAFIKIANL